MRIQHWSGGLIVAAILAGMPGSGVAQTSVPATHGVLAASEARMKRGVVLRKALLDAMEESYKSQGVWPRAILGGEEGWIYTPPGPEVNAEALVAGATVVVHEPLDANPQGVWVGYADGHLEFATDQAALQQCGSQVETAKRAVAVRDGLKRATTQPAGSNPPGAISGSLRVKVVDTDGHFMEGAHLGVFRLAGRSEGHEPQVYMHRGDKTEPVITDSKGEAVLTAKDVFSAKFSTQPVAPLWVMDPKRGLAGFEELNRSDFANAPVRTIRVAPACTLKGRVTGVGLWQTGRSVKRTIVLPALPGKQMMYTFESVWDGNDFEFPMPAGDWQMDIYGTLSNSVYRFVHIEPGRNQIELNIDLPLQTTGELLGKPAPELTQIKDWKNGGPLKLAELKGKVVLLDFWGYWCGPCVGAMPDLMKLHDAFHDKGLVIVAIHDDSVASIQEMDQKLEQVRKNRWNGRDLPFPIALDGGGQTRVVHSASTASGATTAAYGIHSFPTSLLIGRDGKVLCEIEVRDKDAAAQLERILKTGEPIE